VVCRRRAGDNPGRSSNTHLNKHPFSPHISPQPPSEEGRCYRTVATRGSGTGSNTITRIKGSPSTAAHEHSGKHTRVEEASPTSPCPPQCGNLTISRPVYGSILRSLRTQASPSHSIHQGRSVLQFLFPGQRTRTGFSTFQVGGDIKRSQELSATPERPPRKARLVPGYRDCVPPKHCTWVGRWRPKSILRLPSLLRTPFASHDIEIENYATTCASLAVASSAPLLSNTGRRWSWLSPPQSTTWLRERNGSVRRREKP
jgi:hypothetical protein